MWLGLSNDLPEMLPCRSMHDISTWWTQQLTFNMVSFGKSLDPLECYSQKLNSKERRADMIWFSACNCKPHSGIIYSQFWPLCLFSWTLRRSSLACYSRLASNGWEAVEIICVTYYGGTVKDLLWFSLPKYDVSFVGLFQMDEIQLNFTGLRPSAKTYIEELMAWWRVNNTSNPTNCSGERYYALSRFPATYLKRV